MRTPREPFSWDGDDDELVSPEILLGSSGPKIVNEAETFLLEAQEAIGREDTNPSITVPGLGKTGPRVPSLAAVMDRSISRRKLLAGLAVVCLFAFVHGWSVRSASAQEASSTCVSDHCSSRSASSEWKEEQRS